MFGRTESKPSMLVPMASVLLTIVWDQVRILSTSYESSQTYFVVERAIHNVDVLGIIVSIVDVVGKLSKLSGNLFDC